MELEWTKLALADRERIYDFIETDNPRAALALDERFESLAARLTSHPGIGRPGRIEGTRELVAHRNYILVYETVSDIVRILRVLHAAIKWPVVLDE